MAVVVYRSVVLRTYRRILREARHWQSANGIESQTLEERKYIEEEAGRLFRKNKTLTEEEEIKACLQEANARLELALHYRNPYPRPMNTPPFHVPSVKVGKLQKTRVEQSKPIYIRSQDM